MPVRIAISALFLLASIAIAQAETQRVTVKRGKTTLVGAHYVYEEGTCRTAILPKLKLENSPANGRVAFSKYAGRITEKGHKCEGAPIKAMLVKYTPKRGYRGTDTFSVSYRWYRYIGHRLGVLSTVKYVITVE